MNNSFKNILLFLYIASAIFSVRAETIAEANVNIENKKYIAAEKILKTLSARGDVDATIRLGYLYCNYEKLEKKFTCSDGLKTIQSLVDGGNVAAMLQMAQIYSWSKEKSDLEKSFSLYRRASDTGDNEAVYRLAEILDGSGLSANFNGDTKYRNKKESKRLFEIAANNGYPPAIRQMQRIERPNDDVNTLNRHMSWLNKGVQVGDIQSIICLGLRYEVGAGVGRDARKALDLYLQAIESGFTLSENSLGHDFDLYVALGAKYEIGLGATKNEKEAKKWYAKSGKKKNENGIITYARDASLESIFLCPLSSSEKTLSFDYWNKIEAENGDFEAMYFYGRQLLNEKPPQLGKALALLNASADKGVKNSIELLGDLYSSGDILPKSDDLAAKYYRQFRNIASNREKIFKGMGFVYRDIEKALYWLETPAANGNAFAQYWMGRQIDALKAKTIFYGKSSDWYLRSAEKEYAPAQYESALLYLAGKDVIKNERKAFDLLAKSAVQGLDSSQYELGRMYYDGQGTKKDKELAYFWWLISAAQNNEKATKARDDLERELTIAIKQRIQRNASGWSATIKYSYNYTFAGYPENDD